MRGRPAWLTAAALLAGLWVLAPQPCGAHSKGLAQGQVGIFHTDARVYGYSADSGLWRSHELDGDVIERCLCDHLGIVATTNAIYAFNPTADLWISTPCASPAQGISASGAVAVVMTYQTAYAISTVWAAWRPLELGLAGGSSSGYGSGDDFALVWAERQAHAYSGGTGQWLTVELDAPAIGGIASAGLGLVWTSGSAYAYRPSPNEWIELDIAAPQSFSVNGAGDVGIVWNNTQAHAFSRPRGSWYSLDPGERIEGGTAGGEVGLTWTDRTVYAFNANSGSWCQITPEEDEALAAPRAQTRPAEALCVTPNPGAAPTIRLSLSGAERWEVEILDVAGRSVRTAVCARGEGETTWEWDRRDDAGHRVANGAYWVRARGGERTEVRRILLVEP